MKNTRHVCRILTVLAVMAGIRCIVAQSGNDLLLPFPTDVKKGPAASASGAPAGAVPDREAGVPASRDEQTRRALELADTFLRRQQSEVTNSVPRRGLSATHVPARTVAPSKTIARPSVAPPSIKLSTPVSEDLPADTAPVTGGPSTALLPLPGEEPSGIPLAPGLPDAPPALLRPGQALQTEGDSPPSGIEGALPGNNNVVPSDDLAPAPAYGSIETQDRRGPIFRVPGGDAIKLARSRGFKFTPAGGLGARDGNRTGAAQFPNTLTSEVNGTRMSQLRPPAHWKMDELSNTFFMFCDANYSAVRLAPGWRIRGIRLEGPAWSWVVCPRSGGSTASFSIRIHASKTQEVATSVQLAGLTLEGPQGASDWEEAFPDIRKTAPAPAEPKGRRDNDTLPDEAAPLAKGGRAEPPLPE